VLGGVPQCMPKNETEAHVEIFQEWIQCTGVVPVRDVKEKDSAAGKSLFNS
jgi:hypothetical protein